MNMVVSQVSIATICGPADTICGVPAYQAPGPMPQHSDQNHFSYASMGLLCCAQPCRRMSIPQSLPLRRTVTKIMHARRLVLTKWFNFGSNRLEGHGSRLARP